MLTMQISRWRISCRVYSSNDFLQFSFKKLFRNTFQLLSFVKCFSLRFCYHKHPLVTLKALSSKNIKKRTFIVIFKSKMRSKYYLQVLCHNYCGYFYRRRVLFYQYRRPSILVGHQETRRTNRIIKTRPKYQGIISPSWWCCSGI